MVTQQRIVVGAHYGWRDWLVQRITAVVMTLYTLFFLALLLWHGGLDGVAWQRTFDGGIFRLATFLCMVSLLWHAWVGVRNILMDYVKPTAIRLSLEVAVIAVLVAYAGWTIHLLWSAG
ncbi:MAG: succinate dehydrogenase, hydrophobic membrane anchor protein [Betaproteobacteria bacterium]|nr:succinate dehydrogenase, hydrophobic membrane anchor protein [Betaproteobacteria bacterium]